MPEISEVSKSDIAVIGIPFDSGVSYRPGARFGPTAIRQASRNIRPKYHPTLDIEPFDHLQVVDAGDIPCNPYDILEAISDIEEFATDLLKKTNKIISLGGDHTIALPLLRSIKKKFGPVALVHFDAHLDTWDTSFNSPFTHGTPFRRAAEEGLFLDDSSIHVGVRGPLFSQEDLESDAELGFKIIHCDEIRMDIIEKTINKIKRRVGDCPVYISIDIDVLDPSYAPGTGTPEIGGLSSRELISIVRGMKDLNIVSGDIVEVSPAYDNAEITSLAAATIAFELISIMAWHNLA